MDTRHVITLISQCCRLATERGGGDLSGTAQKMMDQIIDTCNRISPDVCAYHGYLRSESKAKEA